MRWLADQLPPENVVLVSNDFEARLAAVRAGLGLGWVSPTRATGLVEVLSLSEWDAQFWLVTHVDLHRTAKVQAVLSALKAK